MEHYWTPGALAELERTYKVRGKARIEDFRVVQQVGMGVTESPATNDV